MQLSKLNLALTRIGKASFSPKSLFSSGSQGAWYDPSDLTTLFEDSAGTTPIASPLEKPVGLMLDKSKGLVLGSEQVPATYSGTASGSWAVSTTSITRNGSATGQIALNLNTASDTSKRYQVVFTVSDLSGDTLGFRLGGGTAYNITANGTYTFRVVAGGTAGPIFIPWGGIAGQATITNISVRELPGNHAYQSTTTSRPTLSARYNLLTKTEAFDDGAWNRSRIQPFGSGSVANAIANPVTGEITADLITETTETGAHYLTQTVTTVGVSYKRSIYAKSNGRSIAICEAGAPVAKFNLSNGTVISGTGATIEAIGSWYLCTVTAAAIYTSAGVNIIKHDGTDSYTGDGTSGIYIWGADLRVANDGIGLPAYQRVNTATDYDYAGFPPYLKFDGTDDSMATGNIDFTATDKMFVAAGVRKLSDAAAGVLAEMSASSEANSGTFGMFAPGSVTKFLFGSRGINFQAAQTTSTTYNAPITNIFTGLGDISGDKSTLRINSVQIDQNTGDQGTGNYGNYPLYIGRRNNATLPFNGRIYSLVVVGKLASAAEIASTEAWVNQKTRAFA